MRCHAMQRSNEIKGASASRWLLCVLAEGARSKYVNLKDLFTVLQADIMAYLQAQPWEDFLARSVREAEIPRWSRVRG